MGVDRWSGRHAVALQRALRMTNEQFANALGMSVRSVANWHHEPSRVLATFTQQVLDAALRRTDVEVQARFANLAGGVNVDQAKLQASAGAVDRTKWALLSALQDGAGSTRSHPASVLAAVAELHEVVEDLLADGANRHTRLERLEEGIDQHGKDALVVPPIEMLCRAGLDLADARHFGRTSRSDAERLGVKRAVARLATIAADEMSVLGNVPAARSWYSTAIAAADATEDVSLRADTRALAAMLPLYHGNPEDAVTLAGEAEALAENHSCFAAGLAPMLTGLASARIGNVERAKASMTAARRAHDLTGASSQIESVFGFSIRRRLFYESRLLTLVGDHKSARVVRLQALEMYPACVIGDPALMMIDQAAGLVSAKEFEAGAALAAGTVDHLPPAQRGRMFLNAARNVVDSIPRAYRGLPDVQASRDVITELEQSSSTVSVMPDNKL